MSKIKTMDKSDMEMVVSEEEKATDSMTEERRTILAARASGWSFIPAKLLN